MKPITREWVEKAEGDFVTARREGEAEVDPNYDAACVHAQQCAEKYLKACLQNADIAFPKTHHLPSLLDLLLPVEAAWERLRGAAMALSAYAADFRYPGRSADEEVAGRAVSACREIRASARLSLGLEP